MAVMVEPETLSRVLTAVVTECAECEYASDGPWGIPSTRWCEVGQNRCMNVQRETYLEQSLPACPFKDMPLYRELKGSK